MHLKANKGTGISFHGFVRGRRDIVKLQRGEPLEYNPNAHKMRFRPSSVDTALSFLFSNDVVNYTSWGSRNIVIDGQSRVLPFIPLKFSVSKTFDMYRSSELIVNSSDPLLSKASFYRLVSEVTHGSSKLRTAVDYVVGFLVNDNFEIVSRIIQHFFPYAEDRKKMLCEADRLKLFLKYGFDRIITRDKLSTTSCLIHDIGHGLGSKTSSSRHICEHCMSLFGFAELMRLKILEMSDSPERVAQSAITAVDGFIQKAILFMAHRIRVINQHIAIESITGGMVG